MTLVSRNESELIALAQNGDSSALEELLRLHYDMVFSICRKLTGNDADANDATQESLLSIVRGLPSFQGTSKFSTWILKAETFSLTEVNVCVISLVTSFDKLLNEDDIVLNELLMLSFKLLSS